MFFWPRPENQTGGPRFLSRCKRASPWGDWPTVRADVKYLIQPIYYIFNYNINFRLFIKRYQHQVELALTQIWWRVLESFSQYNKSNKSEKGAFVMKLGLWSSPEDAFLEFVYANESVSHRKILLLNCTLMESSNIEKIITKKNKLFKRTMHFDSLFFSCLLLFHYCADSIYASVISVASVM